MTKATEQAASEGNRSQRDRRVGKVISISGNKTIKVRFGFSFRHRKYGKYIRRSTSLHTHGEKNEAKVDDVVEVAACRPLSKTKHWRLTKILRTT